MFAVVVIAVLIFAFVVPILPKTGTLAQFAIGAIVKGSRVGDATSPNPDAPTEIAQDPTTLAADAGLDLDTYALARVISSEEGNSPNAFQLAIGCAMRNLANHYGAGIFDTATDGSFGRQSGGVTSRPVSTWEDPYEGHVAIAQAVQGGTPDVTQGAYQWVAPKAQDALNRRDPTKYKTFAEVDAARIAGGLRQVNVDGVDPSLLVFYA
jgi:hypothetical protein